MKRILILTLISFSFSQTLLDGNYFDSGRNMKKISKHAPKETKKLIGILGAWTVQEHIYRNDSLVNSITGHSEITLSNRGNSYMERTYMYKAFRGSEDDYSISIFALSKINKKWGKGIVSAYKENVQILDGAFKNGTLILRNAARYYGGANVTMERLSYQFEKNKFSYLYERSTDYGKTWVKKSERIYNKAKEVHQMFKTRTDYGKGNPNRVKEAAEFDFLIGEAKSSHHMTLAGGRKINFPAKATAVHVLNGKAVMEFNTVDVDPSLPDAATTILRIYNRSMQRWENLYINNRANNLMNFGGRKVADKMVLTLFEANRSGPINRFVFHTIKANGDYDWYADLSSDGGKSFTRFWTIEIRKKRN